jgi:hypothetical protein
MVSCLPVCSSTRLRLSPRLDGNQHRLSRNHWREGLPKPVSKRSSKNCTAFFHQPASSEGSSRVMYLNVTFAVWLFILFYRIIIRPILSVVRLEFSPRYHALQCLLPIPCLHPLQHDLHHLVHGQNLASLEICQISSDW